MKKRFVAYAAVMALALTAVSPVYAYEKTAVGAGTDSTTDAATDGESAFSDSWEDYQIQIGDTFIDLPIMVSDLEDMGFETDEDLSETLEPSQYTWYYFTKDDVKITVDIINLSINTVPAEEGIVGCITVSTDGMKNSSATVSLCQDVTFGVSTLDDITAAYGDPSDTSELDEYTEVTYRTDSYSELKIRVNKESGVIEQIRVQDFNEPEGYDEGEVSDEVPAAVAAYECPSELGDDLSVYRIQFEDQIYELPVPLQVVLDNGWTLSEDNVEYVAAKDSALVYVCYGDQEGSVYVYNYEDYATTVENCWAEQFAVGANTPFEAALPAGITLGMSEDDLLAILDDADVEYETEESGDYLYYTFSKDGYSKYYEVMVYTGDDGAFEQNTVINVLCQCTPNDEE